jgi:transposase
MMSAYSEDLRRRIVSSVESGMPKAQAARTFSVSLSSVKRYVNKAERGQSLAPKKRPGSVPKLDEKAMRSYCGRTWRNVRSPLSESAAST